MKSFNFYRLVDNTTGSQFIGVTTEPSLSRRLASHVANYKRFLIGNAMPSPCHEILSGKNYTIVLIESFLNMNKSEIALKLNELIDKFECTNRAFIAHELDVKYKLKEANETAQFIAIFE